MGRRVGGHVRRLLGASGAKPRPRVGSSPPSQRHVRPRTWALTLLIALVVAVGATVATEAQAARTTSPQHVIIHISCTKVTYLFLGFPEGVTNGVHPKVKVNGKVVNNYKTTTNFYGSIAETSIPVRIPVTGKVLIQAGATWNTNEVVGESGTKKEEKECPGEGEGAFTIEKEQRLSGEAAYTSNELQGKVGQTIEYHVVLKNNGTLPLTFSNFVDPNCEKVKNVPTKEVQPEEAVTISCEHPITALGLYTNEASIEANQKVGKETSNTVKVNVPAVPAFSLTKEQKIAGESSYTKSELTTELSKVVDYKIVVKNTGNVNLKFGELIDGNCENIKGGPGETELKPGESATYTCEHTANTVGKYANQASVTGTPPMGFGFPLTESSNKVEVNVPKKATYTIEKLQRVAGVGSFTKSEITGAKIGQAVEYHVVVKNTGNVALKFGTLTDANCELITGGASELAPGAETTFSCTHTLAAVGPYSNEASIEGNEGAGTKTSNKVTVSVTEEASYTIEKLQRIQGEANFTKSEVTGKTGQTVEYEIVVKNTGNAALKFGALKDANCEGVTPSGPTELAPAAEEAFTCFHVLGNAGSYTNEASIEGSNSTGTKTSNPVVAKSAAAPSFTVEKRQRLGGAGPYTTGTLTGEVGETAEYEVIVKNTGNQPLKFTALKDTGCEGLSPSGPTELAIGAEETFTCSHALGVGSYTNEASITGNEGTGSETSNKVTITVAAEPSFTIEKLEKIAGEGSFTAAEHTAEVGQTADYEVVVKNTGNVPLTFANFTDANCTSIKGGPTKALAPGESATYTCEHALAAAGTYTNQASVEADPPAEDGLPITHSSNTVVVNIPENPEFTIEKLQRLKGEVNYTVSELKGKIGQTVEYKIVVKNTGNMPLTFTPLEDPNCEGIAPSGTTELGLGKEETFTCTHILTGVGKYHNSASIEANDPIKGKSNEVTVEVPSEPSYTIEKQQRIKGEASYSTSEKTGKLGQTVEYKIVVKNTGNVTLKFAALKDTGCEGLTPSGATELKSLEEETFTCTHVLAVGTATNEATIEGNEGGTKTSNPVVVKVPANPAYTIEKQQRIAGEPFFTVSELTAEIGETVEYQIIVNNTGNVPLKFAPLKDAGCEGITPSGATELVVGTGETFLCSHVLGSLGTYTNEASIEPNEGGTKTSNKVVVKIPMKASFTIEKQQRLKGEANYGSGELTGKLGQTAEYKITVKNTGNIALKFGALKDTGCEGITPAGATEVAVNAEESFTCSHVLAVGTTTNEASIEGNESSGKETSNKVTAKVVAEPSFSIEKQQRIAGEGTYGSGELSGKLGQTVEYKIVVKNTGNLKLKFAALKDTGCEGLSPTGTTELNVGEEEAFTCTHVLAVGTTTNEASIEGNEGTGTKSSKVTVKVAAEPSYTIEKQQRIKGEANYGTGELTGKLGQTVEYKIVVKNTGNLPLKFSALKDTGCEGLTPTGTTELAVGKEESFACTHVLAVGTYTNEASIEGNEGTGTKSSKVTAKVVAEPSYSIEKQQRIAGEGSYTSSELAGKLGQTVEYKITVKNTGNLALKFSALKDTGCEGLTPTGTTELAVGKEESFACTHVLAVGTYTNEASIEGNEETGTKSSKVTAKVNAEPSYTIEKQQRIKGEANYGTGEVTGKLGQTVEYKITVKNTGNLPLKFAALKDSTCEGITPSGATEVAVGAEESFTCSHVLAVGTATNEASIEGNEGTGTKSSNKVTAKVPAEPSFSIVKQQRLKGEANYGAGEVTGVLGQTVEYKVTVKNTGNVPLKFGALKDSACEGITPSGATELAVGEEESFTCSHVLAVGSYSNEASIEANEETKKSDKVTAKVNAEPSYTISKQQRLKGEANYGASELTGTLGQVVEYKVTVKNTGNLTLKFGALTDANCEGITPSGATELAVGEEESFTCSHKLAVGSYTNEASIEGNEGTGKKTSNKVTAKVPSEPSFTIEKLQRIEGEPTYVSSAKSGKAGQKVEYKIVVKNTGNLKLKFSALKDTGCEGLTPTGTTELEPGAEESFTCVHTLAVGANNNEASIEGNEGTGKETSNKVTTTVASEPTFSIEKFQRIEGEPTYTTSEVTGALGQAVEYKVVVTNTGNVPLKFSALTDTGCEGVTPPGTTELAVGKSESFACSHKLAVGSYTNEASIEGNEGTGTKTSNKVKAKVNAEPSYTIEKQQRLQGELTYGAGELTGKSGQTVEYEITVKNTGNVGLKFTALTDSACTGITPSGSTELAVKAEESFTCSHVLGVGTTTNEASIEGNEGTGKKSSNKVVAKAPAEPSYTITKQQKIEGEASYTTGEVTGKLNQKAEYKIVVKNTGNVKLKFGALKDTGCTGVSPSGSTELEAGSEESFTCTHTLAVGTYTNEASIEGNEGTGTKTSNKVVAKVTSEPNFIIEKQQRIAGEGTYTSAEHTGKLGQVVEYKIIVRNTGNVALKFAAMKDTGCEGLTPTGTTELAVGAEEFFTCTHKLAVGTYVNEASIEGNEGTGTKTSNKATTKVASEPSYTIEKQQKIAGEGTFGTSELSGKLGQKVEYKIIVKNTGNLALKFGALTDTACEGISPSGSTEVGVGAEESFTCSHTLAVGSYTNEASIEGNEGTGKKTSNKVTAKVASEPSYTIEKQQKIQGEGTYATTEKTGKLGQKVEYKIVVKNTGNVALKFAALTDGGCEGISPSGSTEVGVGAEESFTCSHTLAVGSYTNEASIEGNEGTGKKTSNKVTAKVNAEPSYTIEKLQKIAGEGTFGTSEATGKLGQTVEYKVVVKNTGNVALKLSALKDTACEGINPSGATELKVGEEESFTCSHKLGSVGSYTNEASIEGNEGTGTKTSNKVVAKVNAEPSYTIEKQQRIEGEAGYGSAEVSGKIGQTVEYKINVKNTGNVTLKFGALTDAGCTGVTPSGATELKAGEEETFTCTHSLSAVGSYSNEASIEGNEGTGKKTSNKVTAKVPAEPSYIIEKQQRIAGEGTYTSAEHTGKVGQVVEYKIIVRNTGNVALKFAAMKDTGCTGLSPSGTTEVLAGGEEFFTCTHTLTAVGSYTNEASIEGNEGTGTKTSNKATTKIPAEPSFTIAKEQKIEGEANYGSAEKTGKTGQKVEYKVVVKNTGNVALKFGALKDTACEGVTPSGATELAAGAEESFTCTHKLSGLGSYSNEASIEGNEGTGTKTSNKVVAKVNAEPSYTIEKQQRVNAEGSFSSSEKSGKVGQTVEYKVIVRNTGNVALKFSALKDTGCEGVSPSGATELAAGAEETFTCSHKLAGVGNYSNEASIEGNEGTGTKTSNKVTAAVAAEPSYAIEKLQRLAGESSYGVAEKTGTSGQTVEYKIVLKNTGNVPLKFSALKDSSCEGLTPSGATELAPGAEESFTCTHKLAVGTYTNEASIEGNEGTGTKTSNKVTAKVNAEPSFTIAKEQKIAGEASYTNTERTGKVGQVVEYKVLVKNTGNVAVKFSALKDTACEGVSPSGATELAVGKEESFTCTHKLSAVGSYTNEASIEGEGAGTKTSNKVVAKVNAEPNFTIEKQQRVNGESSYTSAERSAQGGQTMEYKIVVKNTGNVTIKFAALKDSGCEGITPSGATELAAGGEESFTCTHGLINTGTYSNEASIEGNEGTGTRVSNKVSAKVSTKAAYTIAKEQRIKGESSYTTSELSGEVGEVVEYKITVKNTGNVSILYGELKDTACSSISPSGETEVAPGKEQIFTCTHTLTSVGTYSNEASIEACGVGAQTSNKVTVKVTAKPSFTIEKQQKIAGESSYSSAEKSAEVGQSIGYQIVVKNTGNVSLKFSALKDSGCEGILPSSTTELAAGKEESFTCSHTLTTAGTYTNEASIEGSEGTGSKTSNKVTVKIPTKPAYTIEKLQRLSGESAYSKNELSGKYGQKVEYKVLVKNTGNVALKFSALKDTACENISPSGTTELANGKEEAFTCEHALASTGSYSNEASIENGEGAGNKTSNKVTVTVKPEANYSIEKLQRVGAESYSSETRAVTVGQTVEYEIVIKNTGNVSLSFSGFADEHCDAGTLAGGPSGALKPGESATYTCNHVITSSDQTKGSFTNEASITGSEGTGKKTSNKVEVTVPASCKKQPYDVDGRWHYSAGGSPGNWSYTGNIVCGKQISFGPQAMEGEQRLKPGTEIKGGWDFRIDFNTEKEWSVKFAEGRIIFRHVACEKGETPLKELLEINLPAKTYNVPIFNSEWFPSGSQSAESVYQGKATIPAICGPHGENNILLGKDWSSENGGSWEGYMTLE